MDLHRQFKSLMKCSHTAPLCHKGFVDHREDDTQFLHLVRVQIDLKWSGAGRAPDPCGCLNSAIHVLDN